MRAFEVSVDGDTIRGTVHDATHGARGRRPLVVLAHGMNSSSVEWYDFPKRLVDQGYVVATFDFRGHGTSTGERGLQSVPRATQDLRAVFDHLSRDDHVDPARMALVAHSLGGSLSIHAAPELPLRALVVMSPPSELSAEINWLEYGAYSLIAGINAGVRLLYRKGLRIPRTVQYDDLYADRRATARAKRDDFLQHTIPVKNYRPLIHRLNAVQAAAKVQVPTLVMTAEWDVVVGKWNTRKVFDALPGPKEYVEIPRSGHSMAGDQNAAVVARTIGEWLDRHVKGAAA